MAAPLARVRYYRAAWIVLSAIALAVAGSTAASAGEPTRVVVRYADTIDACMHCLLAHGTPTAKFTRSSSLDHVHRDLGVRRATPVFVDRHGSGGGRAAAGRARTDAIRARFPARAARRTSDRPPTNLTGIYVLDLPDGADAEDAARRLAADPAVVWAEPEMVRTVTMLPNDPYLASSGSWGLSYPDLWGLHAIGMPAAWDVTKGAGVVVAVVDTGVHTKHKDLAANLWHNPGEIRRNRIDDDDNGYVDDDFGWDFVKNKPSVKDPHGHGTHVAGTIGAVGDNALGIPGVAYQARIMALRALDAKGSGRSTHLAQAILYAAENGADVINNSWGGFGISNVIQEAVEAAADVGTVIVFASGNDGRSGYILGEALLPDAIAVAATTQTGGHASFSNWGEAISVSAPGVDILSLRGGGGAGGSKVKGKYVRLSGTSMAAPHVSGLAALLLADDPSLTQNEVRWHLELNANQPGHPGYEGKPFNPFLGWGEIDAARAFDPPPITTRLSLRPDVLHGFAGTTAETGATLTTRFTTESTPPWTLGGSSWFTGTPNAGAGDAEVAVTVDGTAHAPGTLVGTIAIDAPDAADGGNSLPVTTHLHEDPRLGTEIEVVAQANSPNAPPVAASNGSTTLVVWADGAFRMQAALLAEDGTPSPPFYVRDVECVDAECYSYAENAIGVASDGTDFLVVFRRWIEQRDGSRETRTEYLNAVRITAAGQILDPTPIVLASQVQSSSAASGSYDRWFGGIRPTWDGAAYAVLWTNNDENGGNTDRTTAVVRRIGPAGQLLGSAVQVYPTPTTPVWQIVFPTIACVAPDDCLVAWIEWDGLPSGPGTGFLRNALGVRVAGGQVVTSPPKILLNDCEYNDLDALRIAAHPTGYAVVALRQDCQNPATECGYDLYAALATADGTPVDPAGFRLNQPPGPGLAYARPVGLAFDGTQFLAAFFDLRTIEPIDFAKFWTASANTGYQIFGTRFLPDGTVLDADPIGRLLQPRPTSAGGRLVTTDSSFVLLWHDTRNTPPVNLRGVWAQRLFPH